MQSETYHTFDETPYMSQETSLRQVTPFEIGQRKTEFTSFELVMRPLTSQGFNKPRRSESNDQIEEVSKFKSKKKGVCKFAGERYFTFVRDENKSLFSSI